MAALFDVLIIGDDEASFCAAACAAKGGARIALARPRTAEKDTIEKPLNDGAATAAVPNFIWRRLDLHEFGVSLEPVSARVTLLEDGQTVATYASERETAEKLLADGIDDGELWSDFVKDTAALKTNGALHGHISGAAPGKKQMNGGGAAGWITELLNDPSATRQAMQLTATCRSLLEDYFVDERLRNHVAAHALSATGLGGEEPGSAFALSEYVEDDAWRMRNAADAKSLRNALLAACDKLGVVSFFGAPKPADEENQKYQEVFIGDEAIRARYVFFASPSAAVAAGAARIGGGAALRGPQSASAVMRITMNKAMNVGKHDSDALFQIIDDADDLQTARDDAAIGRLPDKLPVEFEFAPNGDLIARTAYCPAAFYEDGEWRSWSSQDLQAVETRMRARLVNRLPDLAESIANTRIEINGAQSETSNWRTDRNIDRVIIQPHAHGAMSAAVKLIDKVIAGE